MKDLQYTPLTPSDDGMGYIDSDGKRWQPLNPKQKKFAREYLKGQNATEAAVKAGYTKNRAAAKRQGRRQRGIEFLWRDTYPRFMT